MTTIPHTSRQAIPNLYDQGIVFAGTLHTVLQEHFLQSPESATS